MVRVAFALCVLLFGLVSRAYAQEDPNCAGAPIPRLVTGTQGQVLPDSLQAIYSEAAQGTGVLGMIRAGDVFQVLGGPVCANNWNWWQVEFDGQVGWIIEGSGAEYWLGPYEAAQPTPSAPEYPDCPGAPVARLVVGAQARVLPGDPNNVRDTASREGTLVGNIPGGEIFDVLDGPVCADGLNWWQVSYNGLTGWTVEGAGDEHWVEPYSTPTVEEAATLAPEPTPEATLSVSSFQPPLEPVNILEVGARVRVINDDPDSDTIALTIRNTPSRSGGGVAQALEGDILTIIGGPEEADGLRWWQVETALNSQGWVVEGLVNPERYDTYERTLLPLCPAEGERISYRVGDYLYTSRPDGSVACVLEYIDEAQWMTFSETQFNFANNFLISPDGAYILYRSGDTLYRLTQDGSELLPLTRDTNVYWADWSPDGTRIAISTGREIATMHSDGSAFAYLTQDRAIRPWVGWEPDSETVVFLQQSRWLDQIGIAREHTLYRVNLLEGGLRPLLQTPPEFDLRDIAISEDGTLLAVTGFSYNLIDGMSGNQPVKFYDISNSLGASTWIIDLETEETLAELDSGASSFVWLPDNSALLNTAVLPERIRLMPVNGDEPQVVELTGDPLDGEFNSWQSPTSFLSILGYGSQFEPSDFGIWSIDVTTGEVQRVK